MRLPKELRNVHSRVKEHFYPELYSYRMQYYKDLILSGLKGRKILEIGCGSGWLTRNMVKKGYDVHVIDVSRKSIKEVLFSSKIARFNFNFVQGNALKLPFKDNLFDSVLMVGVLEHIADYMKSLKEINRVLKKEGRFICGVPNIYTYGIFYDKIISPLFDKTSLGYDVQLSKYMKPLGLSRPHEHTDDHIVRFSIRKFKRSLLNSKFKLKDISNIEFISSFVSTFFCGLLKVKRKRLMPFEKLDIFLAKHFPLSFGCGWISVCEK